MKKEILLIFVIITGALLILGVFPKYLISNFKKDVRLADIDGLKKNEGEKICTSDRDCPGNEKCCNGKCANLESDDNNCGTCGKSCGDGRCEFGRCVCDGGLHWCPSGGGSCVDFNSNSDCGFCDNVCTLGHTCQEMEGGGHSCECPEGTVECGLPPSCVDLNSNDAHCGSCGNICVGGHICQNGQCECPDGWEECGPLNSCTDTQSNHVNCGECGNRCPIVGELCENGECVGCPDGQQPCEVGGIMVCTDTNTDKYNCGECRHMCEPSEDCINGECI